MNVVIQALARVSDLRNFFLKPENYAYCRDPLGMCACQDTFIPFGQTYDAFSAVIEASEDADRQQTRGFWHVA